MRNAFRFLSILLCLALLPAVAFASSDKTTITVMDWNTGVASELQKAACQQYMDAHPDIVIDHQTVPYDEYMTKLNTLVAAGQCPDIYYVSDMQAINWGINGVAADLRPLYEAQGIKMEDKFVPSALYASEGKVYGLAYGVVDMVMYYNKSLFDKVGIAYPSSDPKNPTSWEDWVKGLEAITVDMSGKHPADEGFNPIATATYGTLMPTWYYTLDAILASNGAAFFDENGLALGSDQGKQVLQAVYDLDVKHHVAPTSVARDALPSVSSMLAGGQLACYIGGSYEYPDIAQALPDVGIAAFPSFGIPTTIAWAACCQINKNTPNMDKVFEFFRWYVEAETNPCHLKSNMPSEINYYKDASLFDVWMDPAVYNDDFRKVVPAQMEGGIAKLPQMASTRNASKVFDEYVNPALETLWLGEASVDQMVENLAKDLEGVYEGQW
jgi:multiple sugar transport system substrate-binding protein